MFKQTTGLLYRFTKGSKLPKASLSLLKNPQPNFTFATLYKNFAPKTQSLNYVSSNSFSSVPAHTKLTMPALSPTMKKGNLLKWNFKVGDAVKPGDALCEIETDKASLSFEMQDDGYLAKILVAEGTKDLDVGTPVAIIVNKKGDVAAFENWTPGAAGSAAPKPAAAQPAQQASSGHESDNIKGVHRSNVQINFTHGGSGGSAPSSSSGASSSAPAVSLPKHSKITMPALSPTMKSGKILKWQKKVGDKLGFDDVIADVETDKATIDFVFQDEGYLAKILVEEGAGDVEIGKPVFILVNKKEDVEKFANLTVDQILSGGKAPAPQTIQTKTTSAPSGGRVSASPLAKHTAQSLGVDLSQVQGSGPNGRILNHDVQEQAGKAQQKASTTQASTTQATKEEKKVDAPKKTEKSTSSASSYVDEPVSSMREVIAKRLLESKTTIPHYYLESEIVMDKVIKTREALNAIAKSKISFNDIFIKAAALACVDVPEVNSQWHGSFIRRFKNADISVAVDTGKGLITPIVFNANHKGFQEISTTVKDLAERAKKNALKPEEFIGGTFSISNLGMMGVSNFAAVINPPQACILAVGKTDQKLVKEGDAIKSINFMRVTLSCDHRVVDGAVGAKWLQRFKGYLENPEAMLL